MERAAGAEVLTGLWRFEGLHPDWTEEDGGEDGWEQNVAWWAIASPPGVMLVDPLVFDWPALDRLVAEAGGCAGIVRTIHWHHRSVDEAAARYQADVWAKPPPADTPRHRVDHPAGSGDELVGGLRAFDVERADEIALWLPAQNALMFGDAMLRTDTGELRVCPDSWLQPEGGSARLRELLSGLAKFPVEHVFVAHGPLVLGDGLASLQAAIS